MLDGSVYRTDLLAQIRADRVAARRCRLSLHLRRALAFLCRQEVARGQLTVQLPIVNESPQRLVRAEAERRERLPSSNGSFRPPRH
jgi:hypothetical protein